ncbi:FAD dependent oxidoreductase [Penicillium alfredii]|uniref:FAD dependent oxidoreductase n=1 Tax=Penicillium alfredii TaxID=1506179 RepID=A0A9W9GAM6_9EURO|nr:FAD dependent oxidoreductase [Penicillium alfredii]KAJ5115208.1 FAD dependent oxidoreductase [Penicillium alfredii]
MTIAKSAPLLVVGAGTWGISTALHLARRGYTNVTVLDPYPVPSSISAGNDINKIISSGQYSNRKDEMEVNEILGDQAFKGWTEDPLFQPYYNDTGLLMSACTQAGVDRLGVRVRPGDNPKLKEISTTEDFQSLGPPGVLQGRFPGWKGFFIRSGAGWAHARDALVAAAREAQRLGVTFVTGSPQGKVTSLIFEDKDVKGAVTADGKAWCATQTFLCAGASAGQLLDFKDQLRPTAWTLAHIKLEPEERARYKDLPVIFNIEKGFFFEPDGEGEIKICDEHPGYTNISHSTDGSVRSVPFEKTQIPKESEERVRNLLRETMPQLAERPFSFGRICWCADTANREFIIDRHPSHASLILGCGASGRGKLFIKLMVPSFDLNVAHRVSHTGFKYLPSIGSLIVDAMEDKVPPKIHEIIKWDSDSAKDRNWKDTLGRHGGPNRVMDFHEVKEWTDLQPRNISKL